MTSNKCKKIKETFLEGDKKLILNLRKVFLVNFKNIFSQHINAFNTLFVCFVFIFYNKISFIQTKNCINIFIFLYL